MFVLPNNAKAFQMFLPGIKTILNGAELTDKELLHAFQSLKNELTPCFGELHVNVIISVYNKIKDPLMHMFRNSIDNRSFLEKNENCQACTNLQSW